MSTGLCPGCNTPNDYKEVCCTMCGKRLPWADAVSAGARYVTPKQPKPIPAQRPRQRPQCFQCGTAISDADLVCPTCGDPLKPATMSQGISSVGVPAAGVPATGAHYGPPVPHNTMGGTHVFQSNPPPHPGQISTDTVILLPDDQPNIFLNIVAVLFPIIGFFVWLYFSIAGNKPRQAASVGRSTLWGLLLGFVIYFFNGINSTPPPPPDFSDNMEQIMNSGAPAGAPTTATGLRALEYEILQDYNARLAAENVNFRCSSISLSQETPNLFTGYAQYTDGSDAMRVTVEYENGDRSWSVGG
jgi:hypothetical protein